MLAACRHAGGSVYDTARGLGPTREHVRCYCEITDTGARPTTANGIPLSQTRTQTLKTAWLRDLYEHRNLPLTDIAEMAGCATVTIRRLLTLDGVPQRRNYRRPDPEWGITREWLRREYVDISAASARSPANAASPPTI